MTHPRRTPFYFRLDLTVRSEEFVTQLEAAGKEGVSAVKSDTRVTYGGEQMRVDALGERIDTVPCTVKVSRLGEVKLLNTKREPSDEEGTPSVKYIVSNKIDAPASHFIELYAMRWWVETFFRDTKQDFGFGDFELRQSAGASGDWHLLMLAYSLLKPGTAHSALGTILARATSLRAEIKRSSMKASKTSSHRHSQLQAKAPTNSYRKSRESSSNGRSQISRRSLHE